MYNLLLVQDLAVIPMLIIIGLLGGAHMSAGAISLQIIGGILILGVLAAGVAVALTFVALIPADRRMRREESG